MGKFQYKLYNTFLVILILTQILIVFFLFDLKMKRKERKFHLVGICFLYHSFANILFTTNVFTASLDSMLVAFLGYQLKWMLQTELMF